MQLRLDSFILFIEDLFSGSGGRQDLPGTAPLAVAIPWMMRDATTAGEATTKGTARSIPVIRVFAIRIPFTPEVRLLRLLSRVDRATLILHRLGELGELRDRLTRLAIFS